MQTFGSWPEYIHKTDEQIARQKRALKKELTPYSFDYASQTGVFSGSEHPHNTDLFQCDCKDFETRHKPCKHMYRLAMELNEFPGIEKAEAENPDVLAERHEQFEKRLTPDDVLAMISELPQDEIRAFGYFCFNCGNDNKKGVSSIEKELAIKLEGMGLVHVEKVMRVYAKAKLDNRIAHGASTIHRRIVSKYPETSQQDEAEMYTVVVSKIEYCLIQAFRNADEETKQAAFALFMQTNLLHKA